MADRFRLARRTRGHNSARQPTALIIYVTPAPTSIAGGPFARVFEHWFSQKKTPAQRAAPTPTKSLSMPASESIRESRGSASIKVVFVEALLPDADARRADVKRR